MSDIGQDAGPQPVDRKELLAQQFNDAEQTATVETPAKIAPVTADSSGSERARDELGKFAPKAAANPAQPKAAGIASAQDAPITASQPWESAPKSWKKEKRELWTAMTPEQREYAFQREEEMKASYDAAAPKAELADKINRASEPYMNTIRGLGLDLPTAVAGLMKVDHDLRTLPYDQKLQMLTQVARGYGIDLTGQAQLAQPGYDPNVQAIQNELLAIKGQFSSFTQAQEAQSQRAAMDEIERFSKTAEHFDDVKPMMAQLLQGGLAEGIQDAYEKAVRLNPEIFDAINSAKQAAAEAEKRQTADAAAKRAKAAAVSVRSATPGTTKPTNAQDRRSMLAEQIGGLSERL